MLQQQRVPLSYRATLGFVLVFLNVDPDHDLSDNSRPEKIRNFNLFSFEHNKLLVYVCKLLFPMSKFHPIL